MDKDAAVLYVLEKAILVKWDGDPPPDDPDPMGHPKAIEILELTPDAPPKVLYRRNDDATD